MEYSSSTSKKSDRLTSKCCLLRPLHELCGRQSLSDLSIFGRESATSSSSKGSNSIQRYMYDVFISFSGIDTRYNFVDHLYAHLTRKGIFTFKDDTQLKIGKSISPQLRRAIQQSRLSIVVFSGSYANSAWCLDEMSTIVECRKELKQFVFPVFYTIDPSDVRRQNGEYEYAFTSHHTRRFNNGKISLWRRDMTLLANLSGWHIRRNMSESAEIGNIVQAVIEKLGRKFSGSSDDLIGIQPQVKALETLLKLSSDEDGFRVLGIWGMDGIGKKTIASVLYDTISYHYQFDACCFIEDVGKVYRDHGAIDVQKQILNQTLKEKNLDAYSPSEISGIITNRLYKMKLLIVLDDVDQFEQLRQLHINPKALCAGSRIIITTRDLHILELYGADSIHEVELMNDSDAHELLCRKAFKSHYNSSLDDYAGLIPKVLKYAQGLPLAIILIGSFLYNRNTTQWRATLKGLENNPDSGIMKVLRSSFEGLEPREKEIFLHVACFFEGEREDYVGRILDACGLQPEIGISLLAEKSFIAIRNKEIHMHKMLQELGKKIVREQHPDEPRLWNRLWLYRDLHDAMITTPEAIKAKAIILNQKEDVSNFNQPRDEDILKMENLKLLIVDHSNFSGSPKFLSDSLCYLMWKGYPFSSFPSKFQPYNLVELNMPDSNIEQLWIGIQDLPALKRMDMSNSKNLKVTPRFEGMKNLERLDLTGCISLLEVHPSIGVLTKLEFLSLQNCISLVTLVFRYAPRLISLRVLSLSGCAKLENTLNFSGLSNLQYLDMDRCASLSTIHESVGALAELKFLSLRYCTNLVGIPDGLNNMTSLTTLDLYGCSKLTDLPLRLFDYSSPLQSLIFLDLSFCNISKLPDHIVNLRCLERLNLQGNNFVEVPTFHGLQFLSYLNLSHCHKLERLPHLPTESGPSDLAGRYFKTTSGSRNHRSGLYVFDSPNCSFDLTPDNTIAITSWIRRLIKNPAHFRCGFDIVLPRYEETRYGSQIFQRLSINCLKGGSIVRINDPSVMDVDWLGFLFCVIFELHDLTELSNFPHQLLSSSMPHPFYLSFESEYTEERFDMSLNLDLNKVDGQHYLWMIYISREHCHFVETGAHITFKACKGLIIKEWGLRVITKRDTEDLTILESKTEKNVKLSQRRSGSSSFEPKIQLPYNWFVSDEDEAETDEAKEKETHLFNLGLLTESSQ